MEAAQNGAIVMWRKKKSIGKPIIQYRHTTHFNMKHWNASLWSIIYFHSPVEGDGGSLTYRPADVGRPRSWPPGHRPPSVPVHHVCHHHFHLCQRIRGHRLHRDHQWENPKLVRGQLQQRRHQNSLTLWGGHRLRSTSSPAKRKNVLQIIFEHASRIGKTKPPIPKPTVPAPKVEPIHGDPTKPLPLLPAAHPVDPRNDEYLRDRSPSPEKDEGKCSRSRSSGNTPRRQASSISDEKFDANLPDRPRTPSPEPHQRDRSRSRDDDQRAPPRRGRRRTRDDEGRPPDGS